MKKVLAIFVSMILLAAVLGCKEAPKVEAPAAPAAPAAAPAAPAAAPAAPAAK